jgi:hypothetical protein
MGGNVDDIRQRAAEEIAEREKLERAVDVPPDDGPPDPLAALRSEPDDDQPRWRHNP